MSIMDYAAEQGWKPVGQRNSKQWFAEHPDAAEAVRQGRQHGLSWTQIGEYLTAKHDAPFTGTHWMKSALDV